MKTNLILIFTILIKVNLFAQHSKILSSDPCNQKLYYLDDIDDVNVCDSTYSVFITNYIEKNAPTMKNSINIEKDRLVPLQILYCHQGFIQFLDTIKMHNSTKIIIWAKEERRYYKPEQWEDDLGYKQVLQIEDKEVHGYLERVDTTITYSLIQDIKIEINGKSISLPKSTFDDLYNPNFCNINRSIQPMSMYYDNATEMYYLYIMGDIGIDENGGAKAIASYVTKISIDKNGLCQRMLIDGHYLVRYGWFYCPNFWVF